MFYELFNYCEVERYKSFKDFKERRSYACVELIFSLAICVVFEGWKQTSFENSRCRERRLLERLYIFYIVLYKCLLNIITSISFIFIYTGKLSVIVLKKAGIDVHLKKTPLWMSVTHWSL